MLHLIKRHVLRYNWPYAAWAGFRCAQLHREYSQRYAYYSRMAQERGLLYNEAPVVAEIRRRIRARGYSVAQRESGSIHTFAFIPQRSWHGQLLPDLRALGDLSLFDPHAHEFGLSDVYSRKASSLARRRAVNENFFVEFKNAHKRKPVDWIFVYASGWEVMPATIRRITDEFGVPVVNMCLDDKQSWTGPLLDGQRAGQMDIAPAFDISWTSASVACEWYLVEGGRPLYMPEGFDMTVYRPLDVSQDIPVSFFGGAYGFRPAVARFLLRHGVPLQTIGEGWSGAGVANNANEIFNRSRINLGMGGIGYSESLTNVKCRDFDVPGAGGGMYLTSFNPDLAKHFVIGEEIVCYRNRAEMLELIRYYLNRPDEAREIARCGRARCLREHRWLHRYMKILRVLGVIAES